MSSPLPTSNASPTVQHKYCCELCGGFGHTREFHPCQFCPFVDHTTDTHPCTLCKEMGHSARRICKRHQTETCDFQRDRCNTTENVVWFCSKVPYFKCEHCGSLGHSTSEHTCWSCLQLGHSPYTFCVTHQQEYPCSDEAKVLSKNVWCYNGGHCATVSHCVNKLLPMCLFCPTKGFHRTNQHICKRCGARGHSESMHQCVWCSSLDHASLEHRCTLCDGLNHEQEYFELNKNNNAHCSRTSTTRKLTYCIKKPLVICDFVYCSTRYHQYRSESDGGVSAYHHCKMCGQNGHEAVEWCRACRSIRCRGKCLRPTQHLARFCPVQVGECQAKSCESTAEGGGDPHPDFLHKCRVCRGRGYHRECDPEVDECVKILLNTLPELPTVLVNQVVLDYLYPKTLRVS